MNIYRVEFAGNEILSCSLAEEGTHLNSAYQYAHKKGQLIYALIRANLENDARNIARGIVAEISTSFFPDNYTGLAHG